MPTPLNTKSRLILFFAQGLGSGRIPFAPGTFGSVVGVLWVWALAAIGSYPLYLAATAGGIALSVWLSGEAEKILGETDPGSIVIDEIIALPVCFLPWFTLHSPGPVFTGHFFILSLALFAAFRLFDIAKPWPIRQIQRLPGGWGVTIDDVLAALYVAGLHLVAHFALV